MTIKGYNKNEMKMFTIWRKKREIYMFEFISRSSGVGNR